MLWPGHRGELTGHAKAPRGQEVVCTLEQGAQRYLLKKSQLKNLELHFIYGNV